MTTYWLETLWDEDRSIRALANYLVALMHAREYRVISEVRVAQPNGELVPYPEGMILVHLEVDVEEFDVEVG